MKIFSRISLIVVSSLLLASCTTSNMTEQVERTFNVEDKPMPDNSFLPADVNIVSLGDSLTAGVGDSKELGGYVPLLEKSLEDKEEFGEVTIANYGKRGNRSDQLLKRVKEEEEIRSSINEADSVIITVGGNDVMKVFRSNFPSLTFDDFIAAQVQFEERLTNIFSEIRTINPNASIVLMGIYNPFIMLSSDIEEMGVIVNEWNETAESIAGQWDNTAFVQISDIFSETEENLLYTDYFHPNDAGYRLIAGRIEQGLLTVLADSEE
ncbi:GDSL family lipase [Jeotgalibacillus sp. S-D1]|uniref:SGNH/GDSL hydrolase family protein n=1 Tax=Jeotgalibacillus sp. S-D1 TaxID=2552189 RepID=UPI001059A405|nr:SGNH/GDSL hydrolase family protein [Jeotgalibacillus sp. S-D1]TDL34804.1 GDSL family lipase [Jeotgalibacillus sp. S-D1]